MILGLFFLGLIISGCEINPQIQDEEEVTVILPDWPPKDSFSENYPALSRWVISVVGVDFQLSYSTTESTVSVHVKKNRPFCLLARPITLLQNGKECAYFYPAGFLYPWNQDGDYTSNYATWEQGFLADIMAKFLRDARDNCMPAGDTAWITSTFNWQKAQETIEKKITESMELYKDGEDAVQKFYNPWLVPAAPILENLSASQFKSSLLNMTGCYAVSTEILEQKIQACTNGTVPDALPLLSAFIPENRCLPEKKQFTVRKDQKILISSVKNYGILVSFHSSKNISLAFIFLPIYI